MAAVGTRSRCEKNCRPYPRPFQLLISKYHSPGLPNTYIRVCRYRVVYEPDLPVQLNSLSKSHCHTCFTDFQRLIPLVLERCNFGIDDGDDCRYLDQVLTACLPDKQAYAYIRYLELGRYNMFNETRFSPDLYSLMREFTQLRRITLQMDPLLLASHYINELEQRAGFPPTNKDLCELYWEDINEGIPSPIREPNTHPHESNSSYSSNQSLNSTTDSTNMSRRRQLETAMTYLSEDWARKKELNHLMTQLASYRSLEEIVVLSIDKVFTMRTLTRLSLSKSIVAPTIVRLAISANLHPEQANVKLYHFFTRWVDSPRGDRYDQGISMWFRNETLRTFTLT